MLPSDNNLYANNIYVFELQNGRQLRLMGESRKFNKTKSSGLIFVTSIIDTSHKKIYNMQG